MLKFLRIAKSTSCRTFFNYILIACFAAPSLLLAADSASTAKPTGTDTLLQAQTAAAAKLTPQDYGLLPITVSTIGMANGATGAITVTWVDPGFDRLPGFTAFEVQRRTVSTGITVTAVTVGVGERAYLDEAVVNDSVYAYSVAAVVSGNRIASEFTAPVCPPTQWLNKRLIPVMILGIIICGAVVFFIETAKRGKKLFLRRIAGLEAIDEAVGRATEMGRPILFIPGTQDMSNVQTLAGLTILGRVARTIAEYDTKIHMPTQASLVMTAGREIIKEAYTVAGRPDAYSDDMVHYVTDEQFGYVAAVNGIMVRERPATCFFLGAFFAESLILAETGNSIHAIQIAGTAQPAQLPFFVAACDYTLIGEELFAASAYLSGEPKQLGSLKGQDLGKVIAMIAIVAGVIVTTLASAWGWESMRWLENGIRQLFVSN
jgi:hypothetical protein